jgi:hypothetical protein
MGEASTSYRILPVRLLGSGPSIIRYLYIKPHAATQEGLPKDRTLFVTGVPAQLQGTALVELFANFGVIERAALHVTRVSAVLLFAAAAGRDMVLKAAAKGRPVELQLPEPSGPCGLKGEAAAAMGKWVVSRAQTNLSKLYLAAKRLLKRRLACWLKRCLLPVCPLVTAAWVDEHKALTPGNNELQQALDEWMEDWEAEEERRKAELLKSQEDDGWTVVQRHKVLACCTVSGTACGGAAAAVKQCLNTMYAKREDVRCSACRDAPKTPALLE